MSAIRIAYSWLDAHPHHDLYQHYWRYLPAREQEKINRYHRQEDRCRSLLGKALLVEMLRERGIDPLLLKQLNYTSYHRPWLDAGFDFNISHSANLVICAISGQVRIGIDCEEIQPLKEDAYHSFFSQDELRLINGNQDLFYMLWAKKESLIKAVGTGVHIDLPALDVRSGETVVEETCYRIKTIDVDPNYACALAYTRDAGADEPEIRVGRMDLLASEF